MTKIKLKTFKTQLLPFNNFKDLLYNSFQSCCLYKAFLSTQNTRKKADLLFFLMKKQAEKIG